jgi:alcohol dehydrogenase
MEPIPPFSFALPTRILFETGGLKHLPGILEELGVRKPFVVADPGVRDAGIVERIEAQLAGAGVDFHLFSEIDPNPRDRSVDQGALRMQELGADGIVAVGGGSPIDCAKAMAAVAAHGKSVRDLAGPGRLSRPVVPIVAIPTTAGTGSEVTFGAVITDTRRNFKFSVKGPQLAPAVALLDPSLTLSKPPDLTASTGMDALTHAVEAYTVKGANPLSDAMALHAVERIAAHLPAAVENGNDLEARAGMLLASLVAGIAFSHADVGAVHCIAEALGGMYDLPHGVCNAVVLPAVMRYNMDYCRTRYARLASAAGIDFQGAEDGAAAAVRWVEDLAAAVRLPRFSSFGVDPSDFPEIAAKSAENGSNPSNPRPMAVEDYEALLKEMTG